MNRGMHVTHMVADMVDSPVVCARARAAKALGTVSVFSTERGGSGGLSC